MTAETDSGWVELKQRDPNHPAFTRVEPRRLGAFNDHGVLVPADIHVATRAAALVGEETETAILLTALVVRAVRAGSVCLDLSTLPRGPDDPRTHEWDLPAGHWPEADWHEVLDGSPLSTTSPAPLHLDGTRLYLSRYWEEETRVLGDLLTRTPHTARPASPQVHASLEAYFPDDASADQRRAAEVAAHAPLAIITGGPGSGKTTTVARLLGVILDGDPHLRIGLAAPTGKAAARMVEAIENATDHSTFPPVHVPRINEIPATTIHRLLGYSPHRGYRHNRNNPVPYDLVVVDETSMVSLTLMARLLEAVAPTSSLVFVGDAHQLASVEVGAVFSDLVEGFQEMPGNPVVQLSRSRRFGEEIHALAQAVKAGDGATVTGLLPPSRGEGGDGPIATMGIAHLTHALLPIAREMYDAAANGDARGALELVESQQLLCAHRDGPYGARTWNNRIADLLATHVGQHLEEWYPGKPLLITKNDYAMRLFNGDSGVVIRKGGRLVAAFPQGSEIREVPLSQLNDVVAAYAITVHRSQGSQFKDVYVLLPEKNSRVLTRELFYTALTRAQERVRVIDETGALDTATARHVARASGLAVRLRGVPGT